MSENVMTVDSSLVEGGALICNHLTCPYEEVEEVAMDICSRQICPNIWSPCTKSLFSDDPYGPATLRSCYVGQTSNGPQHPCRLRPFFLSLSRTFIFFFFFFCHFTFPPALSVCTCTNINIISATLKLHFQF